MKSTKKIIKLLEEGNPVPILAEADFIDCFNELLRYELIDIVDERVILTPKGKEAKIVGLDKFLYEIKTREELKEFSPEVQKKEFFIYRFCLALCLFLMAFLLAISLNACTVNF